MCEKNIMKSANFKNNFTGQREDARLIMPELKVEIARQAQ